MSIPRPVACDLGHSSPCPPVHRDPRAIGLVALGGLVGTMCRMGVSETAASLSLEPWGTFVVNAIGACALGILIEVLARETRGAESARRVRWFFGTGVLGAFTTYSALVADGAVLAERSALLGAAYAVSSVLAGLAAAAVGMAWGRRWGRASAKVDS